MLAITHDGTHVITDRSLRTGQIARYMWKYQLKYGFMTNYKYTIFVRQDLVPVATDSGEVKQLVLVYSPPISHDEQSIDHGGPTPSVSVRECMLYLMVKSRQDREFPSQSYIALDDWVHDKYTATAEKPGPRLKHITEAARGPKKSENPKPRDSQPRGRGALGSSNQQNAAQSANPRGAPSTMESSAQRVNPQGAPSSRHPMETRGQAKGKSEDNKERKR